MSEPGVRDPRLRANGKIYVARHGQSTWNAEHRWAGHADPPLSDLGRTQALEACRAFRSHGFDAVGSSSLVRATETASIIASTLGIKRLPPMPELDERFAGQLSGMTSTEIEARWPGFLGEWRSGRTIEIPGGEPWEGFVDRVLNGLEGLQAVSGSVLVISHMGVQRAIERCLGAGRSQYDNLDGLWVGGRSPPGSVI